MLKLIKEIRDETGAGMIDIKDALEEAHGDKDKALNILRKKGVQKADKKASRVALEGVVATYVHADGKSGAMIKLLCETDFVARNEKFKQLADDIAMQVVAMNPVAVKPEDIRLEDINKEVEDVKKEVAEQKLRKAEEEKEISRRVEELKKGKSLYEQSFIKNPELTVREIIQENIATIGENIKVDSFVKFDI